MTMYFQREITKLKQDILSLSVLVEESVYNSVKAILERDEALAEKVIQKDDEIDNVEVEVEEECLKVLALHQPVAIDLRFIVAVLKINNDLERIGDLAVNIAERVVSLVRYPRVSIDFEVDKMADITKLMLKKSLDALVNLDADLAKTVGAYDDEVDALHRQAYTRLKEGMAKCPDQMDALIQMLSVSRALERIADHATNIAEDVIYMIDGEIVRHKGDI